MRKWVHLFLLLLFLIANGGCGGGGDDLSYISELPPGLGNIDDDGGVKPIIPGIVAGSLPENIVDAFGYFDADVVMYSVDDKEVSGLMLVLLGTPEGSEKEEILGTTKVKYLQKGEQNYRFRMYAAAYDSELDYLRTGRYIKPRLALAADDSFCGDVENAIVDLETTVFYTAAGELPVIVRNSIEVDVKDPPTYIGFSNANKLARNEKGWWQAEAGKMNGEPVVVAYTANVDLRLELSCASYDVGAIEIRENNGALLLGKGQNTPAKTLDWYGPFKSGETGITFTVMYWGNVTPPDISTLSFTVRPIKASGSEMDDGKFIAMQASDETLRAATYSAALASDPLMNYRSFASTIWHLWKAYHLDLILTGRDSQWDTAIGPVYWYAKLPKDLSKVVDWNTAIAEYSGLANTVMKSDFFYGDRPINFEDSTRERNQRIRVPQVYLDAEREYNRLYAFASPGSLFPFGDKDYLKWWCTLPTWMISELIFPRPCRSYGTLTIGDMKEDDYLWEDAFPKFLKIATAYGASSIQYAIFYNDELGLDLADNQYKPRYPREYYMGIFPAIGSVPISILSGNYSGYLNDISVKKPITMQISPNYVRYYNDMVSSFSFAKGSTKLNAGYELGYSDGVELKVNRGNDEHNLAAHNWTKLWLDVPVWIYDRRFSAFNATAGFDSIISADVRVTLDMAHNVLNGIEWDRDKLSDENTVLYATLNYWDTTLFDRRIVFEFDNNKKDIVTGHPPKSYPLITKAFRSEPLSADKNTFKIGSLTIGFGLIVTGAAGIDFNYWYGMRTPFTNTIDTINSQIADILLQIYPYAFLKAFTEAAITLPVSLPKFDIDTIVKLNLYGDVNVIDMEMPINFERSMGFSAQKIFMGTGTPIIDPDHKDGELYYNLNSTGKYNMNLKMDGLGGELRLKASALGKTIEFDVYEWSRLFDYRVNIFEFERSLPLSLSVNAP